MKLTTTVLTAILTYFAGSALAHASHDDLYTRDYDDIPSIQARDAYSLGYKHGLAARGIDADDLELGAGRTVKRARIRRTCMNGHVTEFPNGSTKYCPVCSGLWS